MISKKRRKERIDQLKTMMILSSGARLPYLEEEIFADWNLSRKYLHNLVIKHPMEIYSDPVRCKDVSYMAYMYAIQIMKRPWPEAEHLIERNSASDYAYRLNLSCLDE